MRSQEPNADHFSTSLTIAEQSILNVQVSLPRPAYLGTAGVDTCQPLATTNGDIIKGLQLFLEQDVASQV